MLTEIKLRSCELQKRWMQQILPSYSLVASCHPSATAVRYCRSDPAVANNSTACAGVLIAVHDDLALPHLLRRIQPPDELQGYLCHVSITLPDSQPLHILTVYQPNNASWQAVRTAVKDYISEVKDKVQTCGGQLLLGGDWNSVQQPADRQPHPHMTTMDRSFVRDLAALDLQSVFAGVAGTIGPSSRPPSFQREQLGGAQCSSRVDDFLCVRRCGLAAAAQQLPQIELIADTFTECSDHRPVVLSLQYADVFACPPPKRVQRPPPQQSIKKMTAE